jgi:hypothetical protein
MAPKNFNGFTRLRLQRFQIFRALGDLLIRGSTLRRLCRSRRAATIQKNRRRSAVGASGDVRSNGPAAGAAAAAAGVTGPPGKIIVLRGLLLRMRVRKENGDSDNREES